MNNELNLSKEVIEIYKKKVEQIIELIDNPEIDTNEISYFNRFGDDKLIINFDIDKYDLISCDESDRYEYVYKFEDIFCSQYGYSVNMLKLEEFGFFEIFFDSDEEIDETDYEFEYNRHYVCF